VRGLRFVLFRFFVCFVLGARNDTSNKTKRNASPLPSSAKRERGARSRRRDGNRLTADRGVFFSSRRSIPLERTPEQRMGGRRLRLEFRVALDAGPRWSRNSSLRQPSVGAGAVTSSRAGKLFAVVVVQLEAVPVSSKRPTPRKLGTRDCTRRDVADTPSASSRQVGHFVLLVQQAHDRVRAVAVNSVDWPSLSPARSERAR